IAAENFSIDQGSERIRNVNLVSAVRLDPHQLNLDRLHLSAFGAEFAGNAQLEDFERYQVRGSLQQVGLRNIAAALGQKDFAYDGVISGPIEAEGNLKSSGARGVTATAALSITPGSRGIPVSGRLHASYNGASDDVNVSDSHVALPHTRLTVGGSL